MKFQWRLSLSAILISIIISGCSTPTSMSQAPQSAADRDQARITRLLDQADSAKPIKAAELRAEAAELLIALGNKEQAALVLDQIEISLLPPALRFDIAKLQAQSAIEQNRPERALQQLDALEKSGEAPLATEQQITVLKMQAAAYRLQQALYSETRALIRLSLLLDTDAARQMLHNQIWSNLLQLQPDTLNQLLRSGQNNYFEQGWLELINELSSHTQLDSQFQALRNWGLLWEAHPALKLPPDALAGLNQDTLSSGKIAVLLPFSGNLSKPANAIKEGLMTAYLRDQQPGRTPPELLFLDSTQINTPLQLASIIEEQGIELVIGPLNKDYVSALMADTRITTPILALNYTDSGYREGLYQFGLSAEDEARQIAEQAWSEGVRTAAVLTPATHWGEKISQAFSEHFRNLGGTVASHQAFGQTAEFSDDVSHFLATDNSKARYRKIREVLYTRKVEFEEHRRQDIDAIILSALPNDARQLKPILAFNFAGNLPIYATSHVFSGSPSPVQDQDLNDVRFVDTPWSLGPPSQDKILISQQRNDTNSRFGRLYALGLDAYRIHPYLRQLSALPGTEINGETGQLSISADGVVRRKLIWAVYSEGLPQLAQ
ncbi:penicillin-binding protein activator [Neptuniibacter halophilus]|uniref:penicillin-binding protein activator n=1 Tax=Neptuniibacter halophilus TaxID=651666 RepID=UPI002573FA8B|nr:penicillin-binding protein activator [Neptuniibacter halophilus]